MFFCGHCFADSSPELPVQEPFFNTLLKQHLHVTYNKFHESEEYDRELSKCKKSNTSYTDLSFPPNNKSLGFTPNPSRNIIWKRVSEVIPHCTMIENEIRPDDILQGSIGDCYFLATLSALAEFQENKKTISTIFNGMPEYNGHGIYKMMVSYQGVDMAIVIDDYIPVYEVTGTPVYCKPNGKEVWVMLLEKAWAKMRGSYENTSKGYPHTVFNCFSPAPCLNIPLTVHSFEQLLSITRRYPAVAGTKEEVEKGFVAKHAYTFLGAYVVHSDKTAKSLIKLRNPWGHEQYTGECSESDKYFWSRVSSEEIRHVKQAAEEDGVFFLPYDVFLRNFNSLDVSYVEKNYISNTESIQLAQNRGSVFEFTVLEDGPIYITVEKISHITEKLTVAETDYGSLQLIIAKQENYEYITGKLERDFPDTTIYMNIRRGKYLLYICADDPFEVKKVFPASLSSYSTSKVEIQPKASVEIDDFLSEVYKMHASRVSGNRVKNGPKKEDWMCQEMLYQEGGFGYIAVSVDQTSNAKIVIKVDRQYAFLLRRMIEEAGYDIESRQWQNVQECTVGQGEINIIVLRPKLDKQTKRVFPPSGYSLSRLI